MAGFDQGPVTVGTERFFANEDGSIIGGDDDTELSLRKARERFKDFLRTFHTGGFAHIYRDELKRHYNLREYWLEVDIDDVRSFDPTLEESLRNQPSIFLDLFEEAAKEVADEITKPRAAEEEQLQDIQIMLKSSEFASNLRSLKSTQVSQLVKLPGIVIGASQVRSKASKITIQCRSCRRVKADISLKAGLEGYALPRKCESDQSMQAQKCPIDPYFIVPDRCHCVDFQVLKLQENPEAVPQGELPRHLQLYCDRYLTDRVSPGNRVSVLGIYSIKKNAKAGKPARDKVAVGTRSPYIRIVGIQLETCGPGRAADSPFTAAEEEKFQNLARTPDIYDKVAHSIAPSIFGSTDIKKSLACLLFGGSRKRLPDGLTRRGDINVLLIGDPGTAKSQLLKFVEKVSPIGVYTSGKGSSAAGLTASVNRDPASRGFVIEGGAMVLADGGVVCIDEFDKMREDDRVAIHEAMEQQTISIAKAGITTTLNSRCSVLAAANSVFGRWDESKGEENIDFMPTILSRFDMIFLVKDRHDEKRDATLAKHVINVHMNVGEAMEKNLDTESELSLDTLKRYIAYGRSRCGPRLSQSGSQILRNKYVQLRSGIGLQEEKSGERCAIPITVRQLEAVIRMSEALAKIELSPWATEKHVNEALRLFKVSTLAAAQSGQLSGVEGFTTEEDQALITRVENQLKKRFAVGTQVSEHVVVQDFLRQGYREHLIQKVLQFMIRRGEIQHRMQRKILYRVK